MIGNPEISAVNFELNRIPTLLSDKYLVNGGGGSRNNSGKSEVKRIIVGGLAGAFAEHVGQNIIIKRNPMIPYNMIRMRSMMIGCFVGYAAYSMV